MNIFALQELLGDLPSRFRSLTPVASTTQTSSTSSTSDDDDDDEADDACDGPAEWKRRFLDAFEPDDSGFRSRIALAKELLKVDKEDTRVARSGLYRRTIRDKDDDNKDVELTTAVLHLMTDNVILALINRDYKKLVGELLPDLPEQIPVNLDWGALPPDREAKVPIIYMHFHVDEDNDSPTPAELIEAAKAVLKYKHYGVAWGRGDDTLPEEVNMHTIDSQFPEPPVDANSTPEDYQHKDNGAPRYGHNEGRLTAMTQWSEATQDMIEDTPVNLLNLPSEHAQTESGWTYERLTRQIAQAEHGEGGNAIMNLVEAATQAVTVNKTYRMRYVIILEIFRHDLAAVAERTVSRLAFSYTTCAGTNSVLAGINNSSAMQLTPKIMNVQCDKLAEKLLASVERDYARVSQVLEKVQAAKQTENNKTQFEQIKDTANNALVHIKAQDTQYEAKVEELRDAAGLWLQQMESEMEAYAAQKKLQELAERLDKVF